ncbi:MAG: carboxypeptidase regulatory-like domain-containing protein [Acidobacteria bacterium]|nr:carboxypeptidase regulatory-like domain-containing protein [Acidobacteriota bacterium]
MRVVVLDESESIPVPGATVVLHWGGEDRERESVRETARLDGRLVLCAPGDATRATLWAERGDVSSGQRTVELEPGSPREVELRLLLESSATGRLIGLVQDARTDRPVAAVAVSLGGRMVAETSRHGRFILSGVPVGVHELTVRHLGYAPLVHPVVVSNGVTTDLELGLVPDPVEMA